jgi:hypothetical protein
MFTFILRLFLKRIDLVVLISSIRKRRLKYNLHITGTCTLLLLLLLLLLLFILHESYLANIFHLYNISLVIKFFLKFKIQGRKALRHTIIYQTSWS